MPPKGGQPKLRSELTTLPPDGGWGWMIVFVSFFINVVIDVPCYGFTAVRLGLTDLLKVSEAEVSFVVSTYASMVMFLGPISAGVCNRFGFTITIVLGSIIMISGFAAAFFVGSFMVFILLYGILAGAGGSLLFLVASVAPGYWFDEKRVIAFGLASIGGPCAVLSGNLSLLVTHMFGWKWCFALWSGWVAVSMAMGFLMRAPPLIEIETVDSTTPEGVIDVRRMSVVYFTQRRLSLMSTADGLVDRKLRTLATVTGVPYRRASVLTTVTAYGEPGCLYKYCCCFCRIGSLEVGVRPLYKPDVFYQGDILRVADNENLDIDTYSLHVARVASTEDILDEIQCNCRVPRAFKNALVNMIDFSLLKSGPFLLLFFAAFFNYLAFFVPFLTITEVNKRTMDQKYLYWLSPTLGIGTLVSRSLIGFSMKWFPYIGPLKFVICSSALGGINICCFVLTTSVPIIFLLCFFSGFFPGMLIPLRSVIIIDYLGLDKLTNSIGLLLFIQGLASLAGLPLSEIIISMTRNHYAGMYFCGGCYLLTSLFYLILAFIPSKRKLMRISM